MTVEQLVSHCHALAMAGEDRWGLNAFLALHSRDIVLEQARESDERLSAGQPRPLEGIPVSVKAMFACREFPLTASSKILSTEQPCGYDAHVVKQLRNHGAIIIGVTQMDEFGMGSLGSNLGNGKFTKNPLPFQSRHLQDATSPADLLEWVKQPYQSKFESHGAALAASDFYSAGGSSCGSAVSVAHGSSVLSLGSDTGGSVRLPAAWCEIVGLKPSYGLLSRHGLVSYASSLDTVGILGPTVACVGTAVDLLRTTAGDHPFDSTTTVSDQSLFLGEESSGLKGYRIGLPAAFSVHECPEDVRTAWSRAAEWLDQHGATIQEVATDLVSPELVLTSLAAYYVLASAEASSNLSRYDGLRYGERTDVTSLADGDTKEGWTPLESQYAATRAQGFGMEVARRILCGTSVLSSDRFHTHYEAAAGVRAALTQQLHKTLKDEVDVLLVPTVLSSRPAALSHEAPIDPTSTFATDVMTVPASLAGLPAISVPWRVREGEIFSSVGMQVIGARLQEARVLKVAQVMEAFKTVN